MAAQANKAAEKVKSLDVSKATAAANASLTAR